MEFEFQDNVLEKDEEEVKEPSMYHVVFLNDDYTPMDFVVLLLREHFNKSVVEANDIMWRIHSKGKASAGLFTYDIASTKSKNINIISQINEHPLRTVVEEDE